MVKKEIGFIGLGRMGTNMVERMLKNGSIDVKVQNRSPIPREKAVSLGAEGFATIKELVQSLKQSPKIVWIMLPSGKVTEDAFNEVLGYLEKGDILIDGANSNFLDTIRRHKMAEQKAIKMLDVGVSGGIVAAKRGYPMMIGGDESTYEFCLPIFESFGIKEGFALLGEGGSGHYVKMIHNAIEYGMMQAIAEGFDLLQNGRFKNLNLKDISHLWNHGTIVQSFLMEMVENALTKDGNLNYLAPFVEDNGEGRWSAIEALEYSVPFVVNSYALNARFISRDKNSLAFRMLAAMRNEFGGHAIVKK